jgi:hypothetical protein
MANPVPPGQHPGQHPGQPDAPGHRGPPIGNAGVPADQITALAEEMVTFIQGEPKRYEEASQSSRITATEGERKSSLAQEVVKKVEAMVALYPASRVPPTA